MPLLKNPDQENLQKMHLGRCLLRYVPPRHVQTPSLHCSRLELSEGYFFTLWVHILNSRQNHSYPRVRAVMIGMFRSQHHCRGYVLPAPGGNSTAKELQDRNQGNKYRSRSWGCSHMRLEYKAREGRVYWYWSTPVIWVQCLSKDKRN